MEPSSLNLKDESKPLDQMSYNDLNWLKFDYKIGYIQFFLERQSCWAPLAHIPLVCFSHGDWAAFHLLHLFRACHPESLGGCKKSDQLLCFKDTSCPSRVCLLESIIAKCQQLERQKRGVTKVIIVTNRQWNCVSLNAKNACGARTTNNSSMNCHCSRDSSPQGFHSCNWTWCFNWWILCSQCLVLHMCCTHSIPLLTCQHRCSTSLVDFASCNVTLLTYLLKYSMSIATWSATQSSWLYQMFWLRNQELTKFCQNRLQAYIKASISTAKAFTTFCSDCQLWAAFTNNLDGIIMQVWVEKATQRAFVSSVRRWSYHHAYTLH